MIIYLHFRTKKSFYITFDCKSDVFTVFLPCETYTNFLRNIRCMFNFVYKFVNYYSIVIYNNEYKYFI